MIGDFVFQAGDLFTRGGGYVFGQIFVGKIYCRFRMGQCAQQAFTPGLVDPAQLPFKLAQSLFALRLGFRLDQISQPLGGGQIHFPVLESTPGEFSGLCHAQTVHA